MRGSAAERGTAARAVAQGPRAASLRHAVSVELPPIEPVRKTGEEPLTDGTVPLRVTVGDFWAWSASDLLSNATRGRLAEFIVATALGVDVSGVRNEWDRWDLTMPDGTRVEVKSAAYLQSWAQRRHSAISFSVKPSLPRDEETNRRSKEATRQADVYVLALLAHMDKETVDPLNVDQWRFFVVPTAWLAARKRSQHSITLASLQRERGEPVGYAGLRAAVAAVRP